MTETSQSPQIVALDSVVTRKPLISLTIDAETILYDEHTGAVHALDPVASLIWEGLDGGAPLGELCAELADVFHADEATVRDDVLRLVRGLIDKELAAIGPGDWQTGQSLVSLLPSDDTPSGEVGARFKPVRQTGCQANLDRSADWAATDAYRLTDLDVGLRSSAPQVAQLLRTVLGSHHLPAVDEPPPNFTITADTERWDGGVHLIYEGCTIIERERSFAPFVLRLLRRLDAITSEHDGGLVVACSALANSAGQVVLGPRGLRSALIRRQSQLGELRLTLLDETVRIDPAQARIIVPGCRLYVDTAPLASLGVSRDRLIGGEEYELRGWAVYHRDPEMILGRGRAAAIAMQQVRNRDTWSTDALATTVADLLSRMDFRAMTSDWQAFVDYAQDLLAN
jgi:hypothetical protein